MNTTSSSSRLQYLDWVRGLGAVIMLHGHVWDSFLRDDLRSGGPYIFSQFLGGMPPAIFLFLTGLTLAFLMDSSERKGMAPAARVRLCAVLGLAIAFASPLVSQLNWAGVPWMVRDYIVPDQRLFGFFPQ